nr:hypothetical protein BaRGS_034064 [Batillaria attramentaria]
MVPEKEGKRKLIGSHFYEVTTPKAPIQLKLNVIGIADTSFTTCISMMVGGRLKPSIIIKNLNSVLHRESGLVEQVPMWWRTHFSNYLPKFPEKPVILNPPEVVGQTFSHHLTVPYSDTDTSGKTRHPMYMRYFFDNMSIASNRGFYRKFTDTHEHQVRRMFMVSYGTSQWGDALTVETFENPEEEDLKVHCFVGKNGQIQWYGCIEFFPTNIT